MGENEWSVVVCDRSDRLNVKLSGNTRVCAHARMCVLHLFTDGATTTAEGKERKRERFMRKWEER